MKPVDDVYKALLVASIPFFVIICAILGYCLVEFRAKPDDAIDKDGSPFHGSTKIEIVWTIIPTIVVMALGLYAWAVLDKVEAAKPNSMTIKVIGQWFRTTARSTSR
jgi:cytochrome c oxidase subunit 2